MSTNLGDDSGLVGKAKSKRPAETTRSNGRQTSRSSPTAELVPPIPKPEFALEDLRQERELLSEKRAQQKLLLQSSVPTATRFRAEAKTRA
jgi:hypothetical protein